MDLCIYEIFCGIHDVIKKIYHSRKHFAKLIKKIKKKQCVSLSIFFFSRSEQSRERSCNNSFHVHDATKKTLSETIAQTDERWLAAKLNFTGRFTFVHEANCGGRALK